MATHAQVKKEKAIVVEVLTKMGFYTRKKTESYGFANKEIYWLGSDTVYIGWKCSQLGEISIFNADYAATIQIDDSLEANIEEWMHYNSNDPKPTTRGALSKRFKTIRNDIKNFLNN